MSADQLIAVSTGSTIFNHLIWWNVRVKPFVLINVDNVLGGLKEVEA